MALGTTVNHLLNRVQRDAVLGLHGPVYTLGSAYMAGATSIVLGEDPQHMGPGSIVAIDAELFYVTMVDAGSKTLTVIPGYLGSTQANHSTPNVVEVDPRTPKAALVDYAYQEIASWSGELWRTTTLNLAGTTRERTYDLTGVTGDVYFLLDVRRKPEQVPVDDFFHLSWIGDSWPHMEGRLLRNMDVSEFASGFALQLLTPPRTDATLRVFLAQPFDLDPFDLSTDLVSSVGLEAAWLDILEFGVRWRALSALTTGRVDWRTAGMVREGEEVTPLDMIRTAGMARDMRNLRLKAEGLQLRARFTFRDN